MNIINKTLLLVVFLLMSAILYSQRDFKVIGHKGTCYSYPDNTLYSLEQSFIEGAWAAECDVRPTLDNILVLCHEGTVDKATNSLGYIDELKYSYLKTLDAGSWKDKRFAGLNIPTLVDGLKLADKYHRKLYLDMVGWHPDLLAKAIKDAGVSADICFTDPYTFDEISAYRAVIPDLHFIYFGDPPADINDESFYTFLKNNNAYGAELYYKDIMDTINNKWTLQFRDNLHKHGLDLWVYTVNDTAIMRYCRKFGIDGIESDRPAALQNMFINHRDGGFFPEKRITGQWDFNNKDLSPTIGSQMIFRGDDDPYQKPVFNTASGFGIPLIDGKDANIMLVQPFDSLHFLEFYSNIVPEDIPTPIRDWNYSLIIDLLKPASSDQPYIALYQTDANNLDDATAFIKTATGGIGIYGKYDGKIENDRWYRIALVVDAVKGSFDKYIDGQYVGSTNFNPDNGGKFAVYNNWGGLGTLLFSDNSGETDYLFVNSVQIRSYAMNADEVALLGKASADKIPQLLKVDLSLCPVISLQPANVMAAEGDSVSFSIEAGSDVNYLWQMKTSTTWDDIKGVSFSDKASPVMHINRVPLSLNNTQFRCIVSNDCYVTSKIVTLFVTPNNNDNYGTISGRLVYDNAQLSPLSNTKIILNDSKGNEVDYTYSDISGYYYFSGLLPAVYNLVPEVLKPWDGCNPTDALIINKYYVRLIQINDPLALKAADLNLDNNINATDALWINKRFVRLISSFASSDWIFESIPITVNKNDVNFDIKVICAGDVNGSYKL